MKKDVKILCVDDDARVLDFLKRTLENEGYHIELAFSVEDAIRLFEEKGAYDLIISDYRMPFTDGISLLKEIKGRYPQTSRIILTGKKEYEAFAPEIKEGVVQFYLAKPCRAEDLKEAVSSFLN